MQNPPPRLGATACVGLLASVHEGVQRHARDARGALLGPAGVSGVADKVEYAHERTADMERR